MPEFLDMILASTREDLDRRKKDTPLDKHKALAAARGEGVFLNAVGSSGISVIAEIKRASPSKGMIRQELDVASIAAAYERAGASAISVLTEEHYFLGSLDDLKAARKACSLPLLRKDFIIDPYQIWEAVSCGADAVLLIVAALSQNDLKMLIREARNVGLDCLVEIHDSVELDRALETDAPLIGINNRDLRTFEVSLETSINLIESVPEGRMVVSESGISSHDDVNLLADAGVNAVLVGELLMRSPDPGAMLKELLD